MLYLFGFTLSSETVHNQIGRFIKEVDKDIDIQYISQLEKEICDRENMKKCIIFSVSPLPQVSKSTHKKVSRKKHV